MYEEDIDMDYEEAMGFMGFEAIRRDTIFFK